MNKNVHTQKETMYRLKTINLGHEVHASRSLNESINEEEQDQDQGEGEGKDEDENNEQQDFGDRDEEAMYDDDILDEEGFAEL